MTTRNQGLPIWCYAVTGMAIATATLLLIEPFLRGLEYLAAMIG